MGKADIGLIGLAVMGENLALNMESRGFAVCVFNRTAAKVTDFLEKRAAGKNISGALSLEDFVNNLKTPRRIMLMVKAGRPVDDFIEKLIPLLSKGDIIIDGGNSHFEDTERRTAYLEGKGLLYIGTGVSGGEEGALKGPSLMPGGSPAAWEQVKDIFRGICARTEDNSPCCGWVGKGGAGHFVKMVHNGIEYGDMELICEAYQLMRMGLKMNAGEMQAVFKKWNEAELNSYLIEITADILGKKDEDGSPLLEHILDAAGQKGTGKWTVIAALENGTPLTLISEAVFARCLSAAKEERMQAAETFSGPEPLLQGNLEDLLSDIKSALYASKIVSYAQGYALMRSAAETYGWELNYGDIALMWRGGCIIRSAFLGEIKKSYDRNPDLPNLMLDGYFKSIIEKSQAGWRRICAAAALAGIPVPAMSSALSYYDGYRCGSLPANLLQAQRDYFGAHTYERTDAPRGKAFHTDWTGEGGNTSASVYNA